MTTEPGPDQDREDAGPSLVDSPIASEFRQAKYFARLPGRRILWPVLHTVECGETIGATDATAGMFVAGTRKVSAHYVGGAQRIVQCVREADCAWAAGHTANLYGVHVELPGRAEQTADEWRDAFSTAELALAARLVRDVCDRNELPIARVEVEDARALRPGILDHYTCTLAFGESDHHDVGPSFPWDDFLELVRATA